ncbi:MAG: preprotein translocase subunit SecE [Chloroflexi bacterium]|nr:preprotein translocase subunit SecE [Chloroflexota bacterium]
MANQKENAIAKYLKETKAELQKVVWPSRQEVKNLTLIVLGVTAGMSVLLGVVDWLFTKLFSLIIR